MSWKIFVMELSEHPEGKQMPTEGVLGTAAILGWKEKHLIGGNF